MMEPEVNPVTLVTPVVPAPGLRLSATNNTERSNGYA